MSCAYCVSDSGSAYDDVQVARDHRTEGPRHWPPRRRHQARPLLRGLPRASRHPSGRVVCFSHQRDIAKQSRASTVDADHHLEHHLDVLDRDQDLLHSVLFLIKISSI